MNTNHIQASHNENKPPKFFDLRVMREEFWEN
jgi:hypothetical protein